MKQWIALALTASLGACASDTAERRPAATAHSEPAPGSDRARARAEREDAREERAGERVGVKPVAVDTPSQAADRVQDERARDDRSIAPARGPEADDTRLNQRDRTGTTRTPADQSNSQSDLENTRKIRSAIMDDDSLSLAAKNVKVVSSEGEVTLRGSVKNEAEKRAIETYASQVVGAARVHNQLDVAQ